MPKQLNTDAQAYDKEYDAFLKQLEEFHQQRGTPFKRLPQINGKGIDLYLLYVVVTARGGWQKVNSRNEWDEILEDFRFPTTCVNSATALKHIYIRYLDCFERINFLGEDGDERTNDGEEDEARSLRLKRSARAINVVPLTYNHQIHNVSDSLRSNSGMSTDQYKSSIYDRLALSLSSPLPNEHDFAFNMCTLLSNEGKHTLQLPHCPRLIEFMLAHTGVFKDKETQKYYIANYKEAKGKSLVQFWIDSVDDKSVLDLLSPDCLDSANSVGSLLSSCRSKIQRSKDKCISEHDLGSLVESEILHGGDERGTTEYADSRNEDQRGKKDSRYHFTVKKNKESISSKLEQVLACEVVDLRLEPEDSEIFHLGRDLGLLDSEGTRISQVLHILRNLSFEEVNIPVLAQSNTCLRFLVLCVCSRWGGLAVGALDTLGNIAAEVLMKDPAVDSTSSLLLTTICQGVSSQDRALVLRSLEVLNRLAINDPNEETLSSNIDQAVYDQICRFLTIHDIMLLIYTLECLYSLSSMGPSSCNSIVRAKGSVQTLVSLLTVEAQSYGPEACIGMKVVETVTGVVSETDAVSIAATVQQTSVTTTTTNTTSVITGSTLNTQNPSPIVSSTTVATPPKVLPKPPDVNKRVVPPEVEEFVTNWVLKNYVACANHAIEQAIVYRHFAASMHALGRKQGLNPVLLSNCVRKVFGTGVGPSRRPVEDGSEKWHYNGIRRKEGIAVPAIADATSTSAILTPTPIISSSSLTMRSIAPASVSVEGTLKTTLSSQLTAVANATSQGSILKAQLSAPLRNSPSPVKIVQHQGVGGGVSPSTPPPFSGGQMNQTTTPTTPRSDNSSLIKSLLANKVTTPVAMPYCSSSVPVYAGIHQQSIPIQQHTPCSPSPNKQLQTQPRVETSPITARTQILPTPLSRSFVQQSLPRGYNSISGVGGAPCGTVAGRAVTPQKTPGVIQVSRNIIKTEQSSDSSDLSKMISFNGICNELFKSEEELGSTETKKVLSFEGILQNGIRDKDDDLPSFKESQNEKRNLLADLLERTVGGDVLNGVVEKDLRITDKGIQVVSHMPYARNNGPTNGQMESTQVGIKRPATPDNHGSVKRFAIEDPRAGPDSRITLYVSQNGNDGEILSQGHQVILNQGQQPQMIAASQVVSSQTVVTPQGQMIIQRPASQTGNVIVQQSPQILSSGTSSQIIAQRTPQHHSQVITYTTPSQQIFTTCSTTPVITSGHTQVISAQGTPMISSASGQMIQQVIAHGQGGQKVIIHGNQLSQMLGGQVILPQGAGQNILVQQGGGLSGQVIMQGVSVPSSSQSPVIVQGANGHSQVLVQGSNQGQVLLQGNSGQGQLVVSGVTQGQTLVNAGGQTMIFTTGHGQQVMVGGSQGGQHVVMSSGSQNQGQVLMQGSTVGNTVFLAPHQGGQSTQKTLIILPNPKVVMSASQHQSGPVVLPRQVMQVVSSTAATSTPVVSTPIRAVKSCIPSIESSPNVFSPNMVSVQVHTSGGVAPLPSGPTATPVTQSSASPLSAPHIPAPQVLSSGIARKPKTSSGLYYVCEWRGCNQVFSTPGLVYHHACKVHCPPHIVELTCQWVGCDSMVRKRFSAMTHIHDRHCNEQLLQILALRRQQITTTGKTDIPIPQTPPPHPGYAPNAAFHAIKRHALEVINQRDAVEKEGPVTKSIRLTAALILRNLVIYSNSGKKLLMGYEAELANVAISSMESSRTVGQILYDIHLPDHQAL